MKSKNCKQPSKLLEPCLGRTKKALAPTET